MDTSNDHTETCVKNASEENLTVLKTSKPCPLSVKLRRSQLASRKSESPAKDVGQEIVSNILQQLSSTPMRPLPYKGKTTGSHTAESSIIGITPLEDLGDENEETDKEPSTCKEGCTSSDKVPPVTEYSSGKDPSVAEIQVTPVQMKPKVKISRKSPVLDLDKPSESVPAEAHKSIAKPSDSNEHAVKPADKAKTGQSGKKPATKQTQSSGRIAPASKKVATSDKVSPVCTQKTENKDGSTDAIPKPSEVRPSPAGKGATVKPSVLGRKKSSSGDGASVTKTNLMRKQRLQEAQQQQQQQRVVSIQL